MTNPRPLPSRLLAVTDRQQARRPLPDLVADLLRAGLRWIWLRDRDLPAADRRALAGVLATMTQAAGATLTIGADVALAQAVGAGGVHLRDLAAIGPARRQLGPGALLGLSAHGPGEVRAAADAGADYATLSPIFASPSKPGYGPALGVEALAAASTSGIPVLALGGITAAMAEACLAAGASGIAVMGPLMRAGDTEAGAVVVALLRGVGES